MGGRRGIEFRSRRLPKGKDSSESQGQSFDELQRRLENVGNLQTLDMVTVRDDTVAGYNKHVVVDSDRDVVTIKMPDVATVPDVAQVNITLASAGTSVNVVMPPGVTVSGSDSMLISTQWSTVHLVADKAGRRWIIS